MNPIKHPRSALRPVQGLSLHLGNIFTVIRLQRMSRPRRGRAGLGVLWGQGPGAAPEAAASHRQGQTPVSTHLLMPHQLVLLVGGGGQGWKEQDKRGKVTEVEKNLKFEELRESLERPRDFKQGRQPSDPPSSPDSAGSQRHPRNARAGLMFRAMSLIQVRESGICFCR